MPLLPPGVNADFPSDREKLTPLFKQYTAIKDDHPHALLLYRLGDFYEMFGPDAVHGAETLGLTLTSRACYKSYKVAMCGVPHHAGARYIKRLVEAGEVVAICEQTEDPAQAQGLVARDVTRIITAGTLVEDEFLNADQNNFLAVLSERGGRFGLALLESSGGKVELSELPSAPARVLLESVLRHHPAEVLLPQALHDSAELKELKAPGGSVFHTCDPAPPDKDVSYFLTRYFNTSMLAAFGLAQAPAARAALFVLIRYLKETFKASQLNLYPRLVPPADNMYLDAKAVAHLELLENLSPHARGGGLCAILNRCCTAAGRRLLKTRLVSPLANRTAITSRHDAIELLLDNRNIYQSIGMLLEQIQDIERITQRVVLRRTNPKEMRALAASLVPLSELGRELRSCDREFLAGAGKQIGDFTQLFTEINGLLADDPPLKLADGGVVRTGADARVDELRDLVHGGRGWMERYQDQERERSGIRTLKVKRTGAFGYFIEVSKASLALVPKDYERKQTLVNAERFVTPELRERERGMETAEGQLLARERELFEELCALFAKSAGELAQAARAAAETDVVLSLAAVAVERGWCRPVLLDDSATDGSEGPSPKLIIEGGCHPVVEESVGKQYYTPNDCYLDGQSQQIMLLTGPNMGGKSTYLRMVATLCIINQLGGYVPATSAKLPILGRIYTRVGAQDYLSQGQSTFMVEMVETAEILGTCSGRSLILLDEVGRGTSTYDGISIAKAVVEHLHEHPARPMVLFATHFFELTDLAQALPRLANFKVEVTKGTNQFVFLYRVSPGAASESFGIEVAAMAGLPEEVISRARQILGELEDARREARERARHVIQLGLFAEE